MCHTNVSKYDGTPYIYRAVSAPENNRDNHLGAERASKTNTNRRPLPPRWLAMKFQIRCAQGPNKAMARTS